MSRIARHRPFLLVLSGGLLLRLVLAYVVYPGEGLASDLGLFQSWATILARVGPGSFYAAAPSANYPPGYLYVLWLLGVAGGPVGSLLGIASEQAVLLLLKAPAIAADVAIAILLYRAAGRWFGGRAGLVAAALYLFIPVTWYDSALWGQVDAVGSLVMLAALVLLVEGWSEPAAGLAALGLIVKPQDAICLLVVLPILVRRHVLRPGSGPRPSLGSRLTRLDRGLGGLLSTQGPVRLATSFLAAALAGILPLLPFDIDRWAPSPLTEVPVISHIAGLVGLFVSVGGQFSVLTANAFNAWALVGPTPLASSIGGSGGAWTADSLVLTGGLPAVTIGALLLGLVGLLVAGGLLIRDSRLAIILGFTLLAFAFYALPTRVHERYMFPFFASGALLAAAATRWVTGYVGVGLLNTVNLHAVLASALQLGGGGPGGAGGARGGGGFGGAGGRAFGGGAGSIDLPLASLARSEPVVTAVAVGQTAVLAALIVSWLIVIVRPQMPLRAPDVARRAADLASGRSS